MRYFLKSLVCILSPITIPFLASRYQQSAANLVHYMALRNSDLREIQGGLASLGLSSLGRTEAHTMASICAVLRVLRGMAKGDPPAVHQKGGADSRAYDFREGTQQLQSNTEALLGRKPRSRNARIMVTMPAEVSVRRFRMVHRFHRNVLYLWRI